jgi:hypothetical protein
MFVKRLIAVICVLCLCLAAGAQTPPKPTAKHPAAASKGQKKLPLRNAKGQFMKKPATSVTAPKTAAKAHKAMVGKPAMKPAGKPAMKAAGKTKAMMMGRPTTGKGEKAQVKRKLPARDPKTGRFIKTPKPAK